MGLKKPGNLTGHLCLGPTPQTSYTTHRPKPRQKLQATRLKGQREQKRDGRNNKEKRRKPPGRREMEGTTKRKKENLQGEEETQRGKERREGG